MLESVLLVAGLALVLAGALSFLYPLRWLGISTRGIAVLVMAGGLLVVAIGTGMLDSYGVYLGLALFFAGLLSVIRPLRFVYIRTRRLALMVAGFGLLLSLGILLLPYGNQEATDRVSKLDEWMPRWQVGERHVLKIAASPAKVFAAIHDVRADEILLFRTLTAIRRCGGTGPESILNAPEEKPLLDVATQTTFILLDDMAPRELVIGTVVAAPRRVRASGRLAPDLFRKTLPSGVVLATMNFLVTPGEDGGSTVATETRVFANSPAGVRRFGIYWRLIHPGSDLIRRMWLRAIALRAEDRQPAAK
ncbi:MAG: hypothetical protein QOE26_1071 [Verrucomicrobiota bacterium]|jgi:hypothetical protein